MPSTRPRSRSRSPNSRHSGPSSRRRRDEEVDGDRYERNGSSSSRRRRDDYDDEEASSIRRRRDGSREGDSRRERDRPRDCSRDRYREDDRDGRRSKDDRYDNSRKSGGRARSPSPSRSPLRGSAATQESSKNSGRSSGALPSQSSALASAGVPASSSSKYGKKDKSRSPSPSAEAIEASKPNFGNSGALAAETNTFKGVVLKYNEPPEARKPNKGWRLYVFKGNEQVDMIMVSRQSAYLFGRDRVVADIPLEHPSASKQHAVLQFRGVQERSEFGEIKTLTKPYIIDLDSANGTTVNNDKIPISRYYELKPNDVLKFAFSSREYVMIVD